MKEWILDNTTITEEEYDKVMQYRDYSEDVNLDKISADPKKQILNNIQTFTLNKPGLINRIAHQIKRNGNSYIYKNIKFGLFYDHYKNEELFTYDRYGRCHIYAFMIAARSVYVDIVTAICIDINGVPFLHTFLLNKNDEIVLDYTMNLVMSQDDYFNLMDVQVISILENKTFQEYKNNLDKYQYVYGKYLDISEVLCFPKEVNEGILNLARIKKQ